MKNLFWLLWIGFVAYAFLGAPPQQPNTMNLILALSTGQWQGINPLIIGLFNLMGIWPLIYSCLLLIDGRGQKIPAWPFAVASFGVGAFALLPYLALRNPNPVWQGSKDGLLKILDSRWMGVGLTIAAIALLTYGLRAGDWSDFSRQWQTSRFIHVMSLDFVLLGLLCPVLLPDDFARRGIEGQPQWFWPVVLVPLFGPLVYLSLRPPLPSKQPTSQPQVL